MRINYWKTALQCFQCDIEGYVCVYYINYINETGFTKSIQIAQGLKSILLQNIKVYIILLMVRYGGGLVGGGELADSRGWVIPSTRTQTAVLCL